MTSKRRKRFLVLACLAAAIVLVVVFSWNREPRYEGRTLTEWVLELNPATVTTAAKQEEARAAIRGFGTNAIPHLLDYITDRRPFRIATTIRFLINEASDWVGRDKLSPQPWTRAEEDTLRRQAVPLAFEALGPIATPAIPQLEKLIRGHTNSIVYWTALYSFAAISTNAQPILLAELADPDPIRRGYAARAFTVYTMTQSNAEPAVPLLLQAFEGEHLYPRVYAAVALGKIHVPPELVLPALTRALNDPEKTVRELATNSIQKIAPEVLTHAPSE